MRTITLYLPDDWDQADPYLNPSHLGKPGPPIVLRCVKMVDGVKYRYTWRGWEPMYGPWSLEEIKELHPND